MPGAADWAQLPLVAGTLLHATDSGESECTKYQTRALGVSRRNLAI